jgi:hypothetical protein
MSLLPNFTPGKVTPIRLLRGLGKMSPCAKYHLMGVTLPGIKFGSNDMIIIKTVI